MATFDNKIWLLRMTRDAFIATDDTGLCEIVMAGEDFSKLFEAMAADERVRLRSERLCRPGPSQGMGDISEDEEDVVTQFDTYPQAEDSEEDDLMSGSYVRYDEIGGHRQRSNTSQWLDKKEQALKKAAKIKVIKWDDASTAAPDGEELQAITKLEIKKGPKLKSMLAELLEKCPELPHRQYAEYAKFDGTAQLGLQTKMFKIFMTILPDDHKDYPLVICIVATARIKDLIGFTCYKYSIKFPDVALGNINDYGLCIAEDDGEVDTAFPCLDAHEPCSKFGFTCLGLVDLRSTNLSQTTSSLPADALGFGAFCGYGAFPAGAEHSQHTSRHNTGGSATSEAVKSALEAVSDGVYKKGASDLDKLHKMATEAPQYKAYRVQLLRRLKPNTLIQLGISLDRIAVEPLTANKLALWWKSKYILHSIDSIAWCQMLEAKGSKCVFRIVYSEEQTSFDRSNFFQSTANYKYHDFESDHATAKEIVDKVNAILELRNSPCHREYKTAKERKPRRSFHSRHAAGS